MNALGQRSAITATFAHDDDGNMTNDGGSGANGRTFVRDAENRLIEVWNKAATPKKLATYTYDYKSRRVKKQTTADAPQGATHIAYLYDGWNVIAEYDLTAGNPSASMLRQHDWGLDLSGSLQGAGGVGGLIRTHLNSLTCFPCYDGNGNLTELRLASTGGFAAQYQYDPFGREITSSGLVSSHNFYRFSTKPFDRETEFCYYGYRYYNPVPGRWLSRDPIGERRGLNQYGMAGNDAVNQFDIHGLQGWRRERADGWSKGINQQINDAHEWHYTYISVSILFCGCCDLQDALDEMNKKLQSFSEFNSSQNAATIRFAKDGTTAGFTPDTSNPIAAAGAILSPF